MRRADATKTNPVSNAVKWLVAAALVFQASATVGAGLNPVQTFTAVPNPPRAQSGR